MARITDSLQNLRLLEGLSRGISPIHRRSPLCKLLTTLSFMVAVTSWGASEIVGLVPFLLYPLVVASLADIPLRVILGRILLVLPLVLGIGILNPIVARDLVPFAGILIPAGWLVFFSLFLKSILTVSAAIILIGTTGIDGLGWAMVRLGLPRVFVIQFLLTFRYLSLLMEEVGRVLRAYELRAPGRKGLGREVWGSLPGGILLRTYERGLRIYEAMRLRGFTGDFPRDRARSTMAVDLLYLGGWTAFFATARLIDLMGGLGALFIRMVAR